jgi:hypothetical protein
MPALGVAVAAVVTLLPGTAPAAVLRQGAAPLGPGRPHALTRFGPASTLGGVTCGPRAGLGCRCAWMDLQCAASSTVSQANSNNTIQAAIQETPERPS